MGQSTYKNRNGVRENRSTSLIAAVGIKLQKEWMQTEEGRHQQRATVAILDIGGMHHRVKHERWIGKFGQCLKWIFPPQDGLMAA